jgi:predicted permease
MSWRRFFRRSQRDAELRREIDFHLAEEMEENVARGMMPEEARRQAYLNFGNPLRVREDLWQQNTLTALDNRWRDLKYELRALRRARGFALTAILTVALGIGATTLVFSVVYGVVLNPYPYRDANRIVQMAFLGKQGIRGFMAVNAHDFETVRHASTVEDAMLSDFGDPITNVSGYPEDLEIARFSGNAFDFLGVAPLFGRTLREEDQDQPVAVLGYAFCRAHYPCDQGVLGRKLDLNHRQFTIVGVMPPRFAWEDAAAFIPLVPGNDLDESYPLYLRARKGVSAEALSAQMLALVRQFVLASEGVELPPETQLKPIELGQRSGGSLQKRLELLFAAVCTLLLIACANVSILLLGRATVRRHEFEIRNALGALRSRLACQLLTEALLIALAGGVLGIVMTYAGVAALRAPLVKSFFPPEAVLTVNGWVLAFSTGLSFFTGILFGLFPSLQVSKGFQGPRFSVKFTSGSPRGRRSHRVLIAAQIASTLVLLVIAGAVIRAFVDLYKLDLGYDPHNVLTFRLPIPAGEYASWAARIQYRKALQGRLQQIPGVREASLDQAMPTGGGFPMEYALPSEHFGPDMDVKMPRADLEFVDAHFLSSMRIRILAGRTFTQSEYERGCPVALINRTFARRLFGALHPVGQMLRIPPLVAGYPGVERPEKPQEMVRIIGITGDVRAAWLPAATPRESIYLPESLFATGSSLRVNLRTENDPMAILEMARRVVKQVNPDQPLSQARTLSEILSEDLRDRDRWLAILFGTFSSIALFLAAIGLYSVASFAVAQRTREIGVRVALGASRVDIFRGVLLSESGVVLSGLAIGSFLSLIVEKLLRGFMSVPAQNGWLLPACCLVMVMVSALASYLPARRAARIEPMEALRAE